MNFLSVNAEKKRLSSNCEKVIKIKLRIICKSYAYLQSIIKTFVKFQKNQNKIVGGVAHTRPDFFYFLVLGSADPIFSKTGIKIKLLSLNFIFFIAADRNFPPHSEIKYRTRKTAFKFPALFAHCLLMNINERCPDSCA